MDTYPVSHRGISCNRNLIDEAPLFSDDANFDSKNHTLTAHFEHPPKLKFKNNQSYLVVIVSLPEGAMLDDPEHVKNALPKPYRRVKYYRNSSSA